ncbi:BTAD domain-containing putative transcriptional regulator [Micromonospora sp. NPDC050495]|uniref:AfsR/SARP family transcriptional regulator n=1 Tax=Micromonospora sp. NPDC050495 TaxID=3154936 RepID=UPI0033C5D873
MHHAIRVRLLGPVTVHGPDGPVPVGGRRAQRLLATLALAPGHPVSVPALIDAAWPESPPATCRDQVNNCLGGMRRRLAGVLGEDLLRRTSGGFELGLAADRVDAHLFRRAVGRADAGADEPALVARLRGALALWTGEALEGIADGTLAVDAARLNELRLAGYEELFEAELRLGAGDPALIAEIAALARRHPLRERLTWQLMRALHAADRSAEALRVYDEHRRCLREELRVEPDPAVRALAAQLRLGRTDPAQARPESLGALLTRLSDLAREAAWRLEAGT